MKKTELIAECLPQFAPTTNHYRTSDGRYLLVTVDDTGDGVENALPILSAFKVDQAIQDGTVVYLADESARVLDADGDPANGLTPIRRFPPGTTHEDALADLESDLGESTSGAVVD